VQGML